jgi:hypothetical protein
MGEEDVFEIPVDFTVGDLYKLATLMVNHYGTEVELSMELNKIRAVVENV